MPTETFYCGNCGSPLYFGRKFGEHTLGRRCSRCQVMNPAYFHYCYRCGERLLVAEGVAEDETM
jgi:DNA-directed RNA polymerase subunit RPC12/RpoP